MKRVITSGLVAALILALPNAPRAHEVAKPAAKQLGLRSGPGSTTATETSAGGTGDFYEVLVEYAPLPASEPHAIKVSVTDALTRRPIADAEVELKLIGVLGRLTVKPQPTDKKGLYTATIKLPADGSYEAMARVSRGSESDLVRLGPLRVGVLADGVTPVGHLNLQQWLLGMAVLCILMLLGLPLVMRSSAAPSNGPHGPKEPKEPPRA